MPERGQGLPARHFGRVQLFSCEQLTPDQKNPLALAGISLAAELVVECIVVRTVGTTTCTIRWNTVASDAQSSRPASSRRHVLGGQPIAPPRDNLEIVRPPG